MMNIQPTYCGIGKETGSADHLKGMLTRVFLPQRAPHRFEMYIETRASSGLLGEDVNKHIKTPDGKEVPRGRDDFYITPNIKPYAANPPLVTSIMEFVLKKSFFFLQKEPSPLSLPDQFPSYLFYGAQEGDRVSFLYDNQPVELILRQKHHPLPTSQRDFQEIFQSMSKSFEEGDSPIAKDVSKGDWFTKFGPNAVIKTFPDDSFRVTKNTSTPATPEKREKLSQILDEGTEFTKTYIDGTTLKICTGGMKPSNFTAVVSEKSITLIASDPKKPGSDRFIKIPLAKPCSLDSLQCTNDGRLGFITFTFDYLPEETQI